MVRCSPSIPFGGPQFLTSLSGFSVIFWASPQPSLGKKIYQICLYTCILSVMNLGPSHWTVPNDPRDRPRLRMDLRKCRVDENDLLQTGETCFFEARYGAASPEPLQILIFFRMANLTCPHKQLHSWLALAFNRPTPGWPKTKKTWWKPKFHPLFLFMNSNVLHRSVVVFPDNIYITIHYIVFGELWL